MDKYFYKVEGDIMYPDKEILTWGPFYYHSLDKAREKMNEIMDWIISWVNGKDKTLDIKPQNVINCSEDRIVFEIKAWKDDDTLENCKGMISIYYVGFED